jgi:hypothetical protein
VRLGHHDLLTRVLTATFEMAFGDQVMLLDNFTTDRFGIGCPGPPVG